MNKNVTYIVTKILPNSEAITKAHNEQDLAHTLSTIHTHGAAINMQFCSVTEATNN